ncbi:DUF983 domain-containing protein [Parvularcula oceani]|uniref:DUF983 domain-containing protein n=1 Tax=Parvularcula oceani TaxID=1247963 RepID=UPI0004E27E13|nr:DUF983 domain-containing protein [Parvularcula oceani]
MAEHRYPPADAKKAGLAGRCPRCGQGKLFDGFLKLKEACPVCGLDYSKADSGDGPAFFIMSIVGFVTVAAAFLLRFAFGLPAGAVLLLTFLLTIVLTAVSLRPAKGLMVALQYRNQAAEGRRH